VVCKKTAFLIREYLPSHQKLLTKFPPLNDMNNQTHDAEIKSVEQSSRHEASEPGSSEQYSAIEGVLSWHEYHSGETGHLPHPETISCPAENNALTPQP
jgi:hypothetical protein